MDQLFQGYLPLEFRNVCRRPLRRSGIRSGRLGYACKDWKRDGGGQDLSRSHRIFDEDPVSFRSHLAEIASRIKTALGGERSVVVGEGECPRVCCHPHLTAPTEGAEWIDGGGPDSSIRQEFAVERCGP